MIRRHPTTLTLTQSDITEFDEKCEARLVELRAQGLRKNSIPKKQFFEGLNKPEGQNQSQAQGGRN
ncbi:hypothetical protein EJ06DRAFT_530407 [Trichodelitschia bisporula]|uniref:Uncharacterized protein n=1 Tax=Trichodelitschia bisporula TaxID=703511 RepID=A0A6G1HWW9_9PEZI|nr:hypothetical protein EJ06DRAFT_530407 [Trichodelitschia bisporula]